MLGYILSRLFPSPVRKYRIQGLDIYSFTTRKQYCAAFPEDMPSGSIALLHDQRSIDCRADVYCSDCPGAGPRSCYYHITSILSRPVYRRRRH